MKLSFDEYSLWCPGRGVAVAPVSGEVSGLTLVVGRSGAGASLLLNSLASLFPVGTAVRGSVLPGATSGNRRGSSTPRVVFAPVAEALEGRTVGELIGEYPDHDFLDETGLASRRNVTSFSLTPELRNLLAIAWVLGQTKIDVAVLDQPLARLHPAQRAGVARAVRRLADRGVLVLWAEHHYEEVIEHADLVLELEGHGSVVMAAPQWKPRTVPLPAHAAVARDLELPRAEWFDLSALARRPEVATSVPRTAPRVGEPGDPTLISAQESGLGTDLDLDPSESVALLSAAPIEDDLHAAARRLAALRRPAGTVRPTPSLPGGARVGRVIARWARGNSVPAETVMQTLAGVVSLDLHRRVDQHSSGERSALRTALVLNAPGAALLAWPDQGLDAGARRRLAQVLITGEHGGVVLCTRDVEFAARAAHRWVVTRAGREVVQGPAAALAHDLSVPPLLVRAGSRAVRAHDVTGEMR